MCELFGYSGKRQKKLNDELMEFFSHSATNPDGWGLALAGGDTSLIEKEPLAAGESRKLRDILAGDITSKTALAHIRLATVGYDAYNNSHPFFGKDSTGREWILIHNGTIFEGDILSPYQYTQLGSTDSERIFMYLTDSLNKKSDNKGAPLSEEERFGVVEELARVLSPKNKLNFMIYDGDLLYIHTNCRDSLYYREDEDGVTISTKPLSHGRWEHEDFMTCVAYREGKRVFTGTSHGNEYIPDENSIRALYLNYAGL